MDRSDGVDLLARRIIGFYETLKAARYPTDESAEDLIESLTESFAHRLINAALDDPEIAASVFDVPGHRQDLADRNARLKAAEEHRAAVTARRKAAAQASKRSTERG